MAKSQNRALARGFSLVELLVALVFTLVLMAGLASVFKASLSTFYTSGEVLSSARRNRMSIDLLGDDLNAAGMYLNDLSAPPPEVVPSNPAFYILPNMAIAGAGTNDPQTTDELYFYVDQPLPFEATLLASPAGNSSRVDAPPPAANDFTIDCHSETYARQVKMGQKFVIKDQWETLYVSVDPPPGSNVITVTSGPEPNAGVKGMGALGPSAVSHIPTSGVVFYRPAQMVRYRIELLRLDPLNANGTPCLVRDQGLYSGAGFVADQPQQIITENISGFKVYLSTNAGQSWAGMGLPTTTSGFSDGWDQGIRAQLDTQLIGSGTAPASGRPGFTTTRGNEHWFRSIPTLVRLDISTRTATQRAEYSSTGGSATYKNMTQSLVLVPRHFGLTMN